MFQRKTTEMSQRKKSWGTDQHKQWWECRLLQRCANFRKKNWDDAFTAN